MLYQVVAKLRNTLFCTLLAPNGFQDKLMSCWSCQLLWHRHPDMSSKFLVGVHPLICSI